MHDYPDHDATGLAALIAADEVTATALLDAALARVAALDPHLNAVARLEEGAARDERIARGLPDGPFGGVPFLLKDLGCEARDFPASGGSRLTQGTGHARDSARMPQCSQSAA